MNLSRLRPSVGGVNVKVFSSGRTSPERDLCQEVPILVNEIRLEKNLSVFNGSLEGNE